MPSSVTTQYDYFPSGTLWPSGDFSYGYKKVLWGDAASMEGPQWNPDSYKGEAPDYVPTTEAIQQWITSPEARVHVYQEMQAAWENPAALDDPLGSDDARPWPFDLTSARNSHRAVKRPEKYGKKGITGFGRNMVKSAATLIQKMPGKRTTFATVTMPVLPAPLRRELAMVWPEFVRQLQQTLSRWLKRQGLPALIASCSEIQQGRLENHKEAYLHLHLVWPNHWARYGNWAIDVSELRAWCSEFLQKRGLWADGAWVNVDTQQVRKSAAGYLSKYMSKGVSAIEEFAADCGWDAVPGQWWNLTKPARDLVKKYTRKGQDTGEILQMCVEYVLSTGDMRGVSVLSECTIEIDGHTFGVGWRGRLEDSCRRDLVRLIDAKR